MPILKKAIATVLPFFAGCVVYADPPRHYQAPPPPVEATVVVAGEDDEVHYVVYREYFGCSEAEIAVFPQYRHYYGLTDDDIYFITYTSLLCGVTFDVCFHTYYYQCDRSYDRLVVYYRVPRERYFVAIGADVSPPPLYARAYAAHRSGTDASVTFTNQEYVALVHLKVGVEYQGHAPASYFDRVKATGSSGRVLVESREHCGRGGRAATGAKVSATAPRPWTMAPQQKQQWRQERQATATRAEDRFKEAHKEQVNKVERQRGAPPKSAPRDTERKPSQEPGPSRPHPPVERPGREPSENPPPKAREQDQPEPPKPREKPKGGDKGDKKDRGDPREK